MSAAPLTPEELSAGRDALNRCTQDGERVLDMEQDAARWLCDNVLRLFATLDAARERIAELEKQVEGTRTIAEMWKNGNEATQMRLEETTARIARLTAALEKYGKHPESCPKGVGIGFYKPPADARCGCGIDAALADAGPPTPVENLYERCAEAEQQRDEARAQVERLTKDNERLLFDGIANHEEVERMRPVVEAALWVRDHQYGEHAANHEQLLAAIRAAVDAYRAQEDGKP